MSTKSNINQKDLEQIVFGYMINKKDFDIKPEMFISGLA